MGAKSSKRLSNNELQKIRSTTSFKNEEIQKWYENFSDDYPEGIIQEKQFIKIYSEMCPSSRNTTEFAKQVFKAYDINGNGEIDFQEFMVAASVTSRGTPLEKLRWAFHMYDTDKDGLITYDEAYKLLSVIYRLHGDYDDSKVDDAAHKIFFLLDKNKDGVLTPGEFILGAQKYPKIMEILQGH